ncbi:MAG: exodeoxyribonuclease VII small subunit [Saprospiraceae bacterium]|nr:exodeoxyribonuclease VII small subunit [Saprospiraceae bacterium]MBK7812177.1 exodeoxyribonuclease VII small subunit [Saprospiraceae bacterium]MBK9632605.1 exodeoxyribonuclease VII small subunit [Saprospiraceae bacterium]
MKRLNYSEAYNEIENILDKIQNPNFPIDQLELELKRAKELVEQCKNTLRKLQAEAENNDPI